MYSDNKYSDSDSDLFQVGRGADKVEVTLAEAM